MNADRLAQLVDAHLDGALTPAEAAELSTALEQSAEVRRQFWAQAAMHGVLPDAVQTQWLAQAARVIPMPVAAPASRYGGLAWLAAAACILLVAVWWIPRGDRSVARIERAPGAVWEGRANLERGSRMAAGRYRLAAGAAELRMASGARLIVEAPAEIDLLGANEARLRAGQCSGFVPPEAHGFRVESPAFALVDLGTAFGLKVPPSGPVEAHVFEGEVEIVRAELPSLRLAQGEAIQVDGGSLASIPARPGDFLSSERLAARESEKARRRIDQWRDLSARISRDPATLVQFTCEGQQRWDTTLRNATATPDADRRTAMIIGAAWAEGRWPGKSAIAFREPGDRVRFEVPGRHEQITLLASVCVDALPNEFNALLMTENLALGDVRWQFLKDGRLQLGVRTGRVADGEQFECVATTPILDETVLGRWITIATTYDSASGTVAHYVEGELITSERTERRTPVLLGSMELGNWGIQLDDPKWTWTKEGGPAFTQRNLTGRIDQFALFSRVLGAEEIRAYSLAR